MRRMRKGGGFWLCLLFNLLLNAQWSLPALLCLGLHYWLGLSIWWFVAALGLWVLLMVLWMLLFGWSASLESPADRLRTNKRPTQGGTGAIGSDSNEGGENHGL